MAFDLVYGSWTWFIGAGILVLLRLLWILTRGDKRREKE